MKLKRIKEETPNEIYIDQTWLHRNDIIHESEWCSGNPLIIVMQLLFFLETPYVTWQGFSEMVILTGSDFQRINVSRKNLLSLKSLEFFFY